MSVPPALRIVAGVLLGLALGTVPFLRYAAPTHHHHTPAGARVHRH